METPERPRYVVLDLLRIIGCALIVAYHWAAGYAASGMGDELPLWRSFGYLGVDVLRVIGGAVIVQAAMRSSWSGFARGRFARLFPTYVLATLLVLLSGLLLNGRGITASDVLWLSGLHFFLGGEPVVTPAWTLAYELRFYIAVALGILICRNRLTKQRLITGIYIFLGLWILAQAGDFAPLDFITNYQLGPLYALGAVLSLSSSRQELQRHAPAVLLAIGFSWWSLMYRTADHGLGGWQQAAVIAGFLVLVVGGLVLSSTLAPRLPARAAGAERLLVRLSQMTYPAYLLHVQLIGVGISTRLVEGLAVPLWTATLITLALLLAVSYLLVRFYEPAAGGWLRRLLTPREPVAEASLRRDPSRP